MGHILFTPRGPSPPRGLNTRLVVDMGGLSFLRDAAAKEEAAAPPAAAGGSPSTMPAGSPPRDGTGTAPPPCFTSVGDGLLFVVAKASKVILVDMAPVIYMSQSHAFRRWKSGSRASEASSEAGMSPQLVSSTIKVAAHWVKRLVMATQGTAREITVRFDWDVGGPPVGVVAQRGDTLPVCRKGGGRAYSRVPTGLEVPLPPVSPVG